MLRMVLAYVLVCGVQIAFVEVHPLLCILPLDEGGYGWNADRVGVLFGVQAVFALSSNFFVTALCDRFGKLTVLRASFVAMSACLPIFPLLSGLKEPLPMYPILTCLVAVRVMFTTMGFTLSTSMIASTAPKNSMGAVTGVSHSVGNIARTSVPLIATPVFAWSVTNGHEYPFNASLVFCAAAISALGGLLILRPVKPEDVVPRTAAGASAAPAVVAAAADASAADAIAHCEHKDDGDAAAALPSSAAMLALDAESGAHAESDAAGLLAPKAGGADAGVKV